MPAPLTVVNLHKFNLSCIFSLNTNMNIVLLKKLKYDLKLFKPCKGSFAFFLL